MALYPNSSLPEGLAVDREEPGRLVLRLSGDLNAGSVARIWAPALAALRRDKLAALALVLEHAGYIDGAGLALLVRLRSEAEASGAQVSTQGLPERYAHLIELAGRAEAAGREEGGDRRSGKSIMRLRLDDVLASLRELVGFVGESALVLYDSLRHPRRVRWKDVVMQALAVGVESLPILLLIGFLMGLIMSFQSVITLQRFGGEIYVPNMLGLVMFREMGPLVTAILLAARSGSAFAAEIGTMRVNEELDALTTMGISPVRFLVGPRMLSSLAVVPIMTLFFNFASLIGGALEIGRAHV
jgi:phospholipid/cholesterol/gamma-HCH transport system permease protein